MWSEQRVKTRGACTHQQSNEREELSSGGERTRLIPSRHGNARKELNGREEIGPRSPKRDFRVHSLASLTPAEAKVAISQ